MDPAIVLVVGDLVEVDFRKRGADVLHLLIVGEQAVKLKKEQISVTDVMLHFMITTYSNNEFNKSLVNFALLALPLI
jgi:hypothetical protein